MAKYRVLERSFIDNTLVEAGDIIDFDGVASTNLELIEEEVKEKKVKAKTSK